jgi:hypothetical protein
VLHEYLKLKLDRRLAEEIRGKIQATIRRSLTEYPAAFWPLNLALYNVEQYLFRVSSLSQKILRLCVRLRLYRGEKLWLQAGPLVPGLRRRLDKQDLHLSQEAQISEDGDDWLITDQGGKRYIARADETRFNFHLNLYQRLHFFDEKERKTMLGDAAGQSGFSAFLYHWLGKWLHYFDQNDQALKAFSQALKETKDPQLLLKVADGFETLGRWSERLEAYQLARDIDLANEEGAHHHPEFYRHKVACARWATGDYEGALIELNQIQGESSGLNEDWRFNFVKQVMDHINSIEAYSQLIAWLDSQRQAGRRGGDERIVRDAIKARLQLVRAKYPKLGRPFASRSANNDDFDVLPVPPLAVEVHEDLFPPGETWWEESQLRNEYLPAMRQRVKNETGIILPGVRFRASDGLRAGDYRLLVDEEPVASGQVEPGSRFFPKYDQVRHLLKDNAAAPQPGLNPSTGIQEGAWVRPDQRQWPEFLTAKLIQVWHRLGRRSRPANSDMAESWDQFEYIIRHLEAVAHAQLPRFLNIQTVQNMLDQWQERDEERQRQCQDALPDDESLVRFVRVIQNLVAENVPVRDLDTILKQFTCLRSKGSDITDIVEHIRPVLRDDASIDDRNRHLIRLDPGFESDLAHWVKGQNSRRFLAMPREEAESFLAAVGQCVDSRPPRKVGLVVQDPDLRPFVKRLTAFSFPDLAVIAEHELEQYQLLLIDKWFKAPEQAKV